MPNRGLHRTLHCVCAAAMCVFMCTRGAYAQKMPHPQAVSFDAIAQALVVAQVPVTAADLLDAYAHYLDGYTVALASADAEYIKLCAQTRAAPGALLSPRDAGKYVEIEEQAERAEQALIKGVVERIAAKSPGKEAEVAAAGKLLEIVAWYAHFRGGEMGYFILSIPDDAALGLAWALRSSSNDPDVGTSLARKAALSHLDDRVAAVRGLATALRSERIAVARFADKNGIVGKTRNEVGAADGKAMNDAARAKDPEKWDAEAYEAARSSCLHPQLDAMARGATVDPAAWIKLVRAEYAAFKEVEPEIAPHTVIALEQSWLPALVCGGGAGMMDTLPMPQGAWVGTPADYAHMLMRIEGVPEETRAKLRDIGFAWMKDDRKYVRGAIERTLSTGIVQPLKEVRSARAREVIAQVSEALGAPELAPKEKFAQPAFPRVTLKESLDADEEPLYGRHRPTQARPPAPVAKVGSGTSTVLRPNALPADFADGLAKGLKLDASERAMLDALVADARERWEKQVAPLIAKSEDPRPTMGASTQEQRLAHSRELIAAGAAATEAYAAAIAFDASLFDAIRAALGAKADPRVLEIAGAARRTAEAVRANAWRTGGKTQAQPVDVPKAVLQAPLSPEGRESAIQVLAPAASQWRELGCARRELTIRGSLLNQLQSQLQATEEGQKYVDERPLNEEKSRQTDGAWAAAEKQALQSILGALSPEDAQEWRRWIRKCQWPAMYPNIDPSERVALRYLVSGPDEQDAQRISKMLREAQSATQAFGDAAVQAMQSANPALSAEEMRFGDLDGARDRLALFTALIPWHEAMFAERLRLSLPEEYASAIPRSRATGTLGLIQRAGSGAGTGVGTR